MREPTPPSFYQTPVTYAPEVLSCSGPPSAEAPAGSRRSFGMTRLILQGSAMEKTGPTILVPAGAARSLRSAASPKALGRVIRARTGPALGGSWSVSLRTRSGRGRRRSGRALGRLDRAPRRTRPSPEHDERARGRPLVRLRPPARGRRARRRPLKQGCLDLGVDEFVDGRSDSEGRTRVTTSGWLLRSSHHAGRVCFLTFLRKVLVHLPCVLSWLTISPINRALASGARTALAFTSSAS